MGLKNITAVQAAHCAVVEVQISITKQGTDNVKVTSQQRKHVIGSQPDQGQILKIS